jgi:pimeloyl-ACP methyl ester carboxylesterase
MNGPLPCGAAACPGVAAEAPLTLAEALRRCEREAVRGVCDTGRYRCSYYTWGDGPPLVFIHGLSDTARSFVLPVARLAGQFRCVAYDLPIGRGDGARLARYTHADLVADLFALLDHLRMPQAYLYGSSFGSTIALAALREQPRRFPRAVLQGGFARRRLAPAERLLARLARSWPWRLGAFPFRKTLLIGADYAPFRACPAEIWEFYLGNSGATPMAAVARRALLVHQLDLRLLLAEIRQPVLLVGGDCDATVSRECEEMLLNGLPNAGRIELANCGHFPYFTHPEALAEAMRRFLTPPGSACA